MSANPISPLSPVLEQLLRELFREFTADQENFAASCVQFAYEICESAGVPCPLQKTLHLPNYLYDSLRRSGSSWEGHDALQLGVNLMDLSSELGHINSVRNLHDEEWLGERVFQKGLLIRRIGFNSLLEASRHISAPSPVWQHLAVGLHSVQQSLSLATGIIGFQWGEIGEIKRGILGRYSDSYIDMRLFQLGIGPLFASTKMEGKITKTLSEIFQRDFAELGAVSKVPNLEDSLFHPFWLTDLSHDASCENVSLKLVSSLMESDQSWFCVQKNLIGQEELLDFMRELGYQSGKDDPHEYLPQLRELVLRCVKEDRQLFWYPIVWLDEELQG